MSATTKMITVFGIADCHGIEGIFEKNEKTQNRIRMMNIRVVSNRHRHAVLFEADVTPETWKRISYLVCEGQDFIEALNVLKNEAIELRIQREHQKSWDLIPNPVLDPWR